MVVLIKRLLSTTILIYSLIACLQIGVSQELPQSVDYQAPPAPLRIFLSPSENYRILVQNQGLEATLTIEANTSSTWRALWSKSLPHRIGPRYAFVGESGAIVLVDEWINVFSPIAIFVLDVHGNQLAHYSTDEVARTLNIPRKELAHSATVGPWMRGIPFLHGELEVVVVPMVEIELHVDMLSGELKASPTN